MPYVYSYAFLNGKCATEEANIAFFFLKHMSNISQMRSLMLSCSDSIFSNRFSPLQEFTFVFQKRLLERYELEYISH